MACKYIYKGTTYTKEEFESFVKEEFVKKSPENQFLSLLAKDNNWVTFFIKSIIADSAKKGYEKVLFPTGNTASKVEGHSTLEEFKKRKEDRLNKLINDKQELEDIKSGKVKNEVGFGQTELNEELKQINNEINQLKQELERVETEGFGALRPIYNFYENTVTNILKKQGYNPVLITDEYGNTWNEITIETKRDVTPVALSPKVLTELQESKLKEFIDKEDSFIKTIGVERTEQLVTYTFEKVVSSIEQGNGARAGFNSVLNVLQERLDELQEVSDNREEYELDEDYIQVLENTIKATKDTIDNFNVIVNRVNFELENTKGLVEDEDNSEDNGGDAKGERYNVEAYEIDPITGVSSKLKLFLSGVKAISPKAVSIARAQYKQRLMDENNELPEKDRKTEEEIDSIVNQLDENLLFDTIADESDLYDKTWFLQDALMPFRNVHKQLLVELAGVEESYEAVIAKLRQSAKEKYWINQVIDKLEKADTQTKNQFVSEMPKHNLSMEFVQLSKKYVEVNGKKISFYTTYVRKSNSNEVSQLVLENWKNDFISSDMVTPEVDDYVFNVDNVRELSEDMGNILSEVAAKPKVKILKGKVSTKEIFYKNLQNSITYAEEINVIRNSNAKPAVNIGTEGNVNTYIINEDGSLELYENDFGNLATKVQNLYKRVGISLSDNTVNYLIKNSTGTSYLDELSNVIDYISENIDARLFEDNTDPINQSSIKTLAALEARLNPNPNIMPTSFRTQGKDVFAFTAKNFLNDRAKALLTQELLNNLKRTPFAKDSKYIPIIERYLNGTASVQEVKLVEAMGIIEDLDLQVIKNLERVIAYGDKRFTRIDEIEQELVSLGLFVNSNTKPVDGKRIARYVFPTFSDKTRSAVVGMEAEEYSYDYENKTVTDETVDRIFKSTVEAELKRIINYHAKGHSTSNNEQYAMGGGLFFFFPTMNGIMIQTETGVENIHNAIKFQVTQMGELNKGVKEYEETSLSEGIVEAIKQELKTQLNSQIDAKVDVWNEYELLKFVTENNVTSLKEAGFDYKYLTKFNKNNNFKNEADIERALRLFAADYKINDIVAKAEMHKLYLGDPAMMFKKSKNHSEIVKRMTLNDQLSAEDLLNLVKEAQTNIGKRLALEIATGKKSAENASKNYIQLMAKDPVVKSATLSYLSRVLDGKVFDLDNYAKLDDDGKAAYIGQFPNTSTFIDIDGADAQELTTLKEYLTTDIDFGKTDITLEEIDEILAIEEKDKITAEEFEKLSSFLNKITTQPQKPVYSGDMYDPDTETMRVVYIKTSAFPLSKHFTKDFQIDNLRKAMVKLEKETGLNVRMSYSTGNKLGAVTKANALTVFDNEGNVLSEEDIYDSINNEISIVDGVRKLTPRSFNQLPYLVLPRKNFRIQQENPLKRKSTIKGGSQERKLLWMDLLTLNNPEINKLYGEYMDLYESLYQEEFDKLMSEITTTNAEGEKVLSITKASELLLKEAKSRNYPIQDIRGLNIVKGNFAVPLMFHGSSERYESLINSIINNRLANIQMPGHSYILGSSEGFKVKEVSEKYPIPAGTIFVKEGITDLKNSHFVELVRDENGNIIDRIPITKKIESYAEGEIEFVPAQVIVPNTIYVEIDGKKQKINLEEFVFTKDNKKYLDVSRFNPDLLKVFGFRIPTSGQMSMATMEIVGFMPENQGDLLLAPRDFTKQMGSDFDVDKLYTYNYEVEAYFDENGKPEYRKKDSKRNRIIEIHHNLLSLANTNVQRKVLSPLSFDIAKEQADLIESSKGYVPSILDDEYQKIKRIGGAAGKTGTGKYSLAITLHSSLQQAAFNRTKQEYIASELLQIGTYTQEGDFIPFRMTIAGLKFDGKLGKSNTLSLTGKSIRDISDVLAQRQNYSVDNEKEQLMFRLNDNKYTMPFNMFMDLAGFDLVTVKDNNNGTVNISITDFLRTQPVILEYVKLRNLGKTEIEAFEELDKKYPFSEDFAFEAESASFAQQLFNGTANQSAVLNIFKSASEEGAKLGSLSSAYNTDSSGLGKSIFDVIDKENKIVNLYNSFYNIGNFNANTINGIVTNQALQASEMFEAIMPYRNLSFILFDKVKAITGNDLNVDDMQDVFREFKKHIFASHLIKNFDDSAGSITDIRREMFFHTEENESFANYAKYVQQITPMALLNGMTFEINTNDLPSVITWNNSIKSDNETRFYTDFLAMFTNKTALRPYNGKPMTYQKFAQMLVTYAYLEGGIQGGYQYIKYVPVEYLQATGMADALTNVQNYVKTVKPFDEDKIAEIVNDNFFVQLVQHNPSLVKNKINLSEFFGKVIGANAKEFKNVTEFSTKEKEKPRFFRVYNYQSDVKNRRIRKKEAEVLFIYDENTNKYYRIPSKGIYGMSEYDYMSNEIRSLVNAYNKNTVLDNNKALIEETKAESEFKLSKVSTVKDLLDFVSKSNNEFNRTIAQSLKGIADNVPVTIDNSIDSAGLATPNSIILRKDYIEGLLKMNKFSEVEAVILEEVLHTVTIDYLRNPENHTEDIQRKVASIKKLYTKAFDKALEKKLFTLSEMEMIKKSYETAITPEQKVAYSLMDEYEFVARIISEPNTREVLSKIKSGNKTYLERILDEISELINSVLKMLGISNDTITAEGIEATLDLVSAIKAQKVKDAKDTVEIRLQGKPIESKVPLSNTMSNFLNNYFTGEGESFFDNLTEDDKLSIATALARVYKDVNKMTFESIYDSDSAEEVFYYFATGKVLKEDVRNSSQFTKAVKEVKDYVNENQKFIDGYNKIASNPSISQKVKDEQKKEYDAILEKHNFLKNKVYSIEFDIRLKLLAKENYFPDFEYNFTSSLPTQPTSEEVTTQTTSEEKIIKGKEVKEGIYVNQEALTKEEQLELFNYLKPYLESQAAKTNKSPNASKMIGLGLRWDYKSNNPNKPAIYIEDVINPANKTKYGYYNTSINGEDLAQITPRFRELIQKATGVDMTNYDGAIINLYDNDSFISSHNDVDESNSAINYPVVGINLGGNGNFSIESKEDPIQLKLKAGTAYVFGVNGVNRKVFHRTFPGKQDSFLPELTTKLDNKTYPAGSYRVTITMRRVMPLTEGMTESPFKFTQPTTQETTATTQPATTKKVDLSVNNPKEYTNHSGGALGADSMFDIIGQEFGVTNHKHYYYGSKTPKGNVLLTDSQIQEGISEMNKAAKILNRNPSKQSTINLLARNWFQVKNSTQIIAIAPIDDSMSFVEGGTGWAVAMAQSNNKEIHVFNLKDNLWYTWNGNIFVKSSVPVLAKNFAGIGSRQEGGKMTQESINAIRNLYSNTFNIATQSTATETDAKEKIEIPKYEVNYNLQNKDGSKRFAQVSSEGVITINPVKNIQELFDYMEGKEGGVTSAQKKLVLDELSKQGYPMSKLKQIITTNKIANTFLILHEQDHIDNKDKDVYWLQGRDLNTPDKIAIETRATVNSLKKLEKMFPPTGNLPEGFEKIGSLSPIVKPKTVSVSGLPTIIVDENKQSRCK